MNNLLDCLNLREAIPGKAEYLQNIDVVTVWGEGDVNSPYDSDRYHMGQLSMVCAMFGLAASGSSLSIFMTSDNHGRELYSTSDILYQKRKKRLIKWLEALLGNKLEIVDAVERYNTIKECSKPEYGEAISFWGKAVTHLQKFYRQLAEIKKNKVIASDWETFRKSIEGSKKDDNGWNEAIQKAPEAIKNWIYSTFNTIDYSELQDDIGAIIFSLVMKEGKWREQYFRRWLDETGTVLSIDFGNSLIVEAKRNMYWLRTFRLIHKYTASNEGNHIQFPEIASLVNLPNKDNNGPMIGKEKEGAISIFSRRNEIEKILRSSDNTFLKSIMMSLSWLDDRIPEIKHLADFNVSNEKENIAIAITDIVELISEYWPGEEEKILQMDDRFSLRYATEGILKMDTGERWKRGYSSSIGEVDYDGTSLFQELAQQIIKNGYEKSENSELKLAEGGINRLINYTSQIDMVLHMTEKRYRDHGKHQINVALLGHFLLHSFSPKIDYLNPTTVAEEVIAFLKPLTLTSQDFSLMFLIAAIAHDHGYPLLRVAWLIGTLYQMESFNKVETSDTSINLAESLKDYVTPFSSNWFLLLLDQIKEEKSCDPLKFERWGDDSLGWAASILDVREIQLKQQLKWPSHGLISAMNLKGIINDDNANIELEVSRQDHQFLTSIIRAIAIHDLDNINVNLKDDPVAYFLILSDEIQEWNRKIFYKGNAQIESSYVELLGLIYVDKFLYQLPEKLQMHFYHHGLKKTKIPWDYNIFRDSKRRNFKRLEIGDFNNIFPKTIDFDLSVGP